MTPTCFASRSGAPEFSSANGRALQHAIDNLPGGTGTVRVGGTCSGAWYKGGTVQTARLGGGVTLIGGSAETYLTANPHRPRGPGCPRAGPGAAGDRGDEQCAQPGADRRQHERKRRRPPEPGDVDARGLAHPVERRHGLGPRRRGGERGHADHQRLDGVGQHLRLARGRHLQQDRRRPDTDWRNGFGQQLGKPRRRPLQPGHVGARELAHPVERRHGVGPGRRRWRTRAR